MDPILQEFEQDLDRINSQLQLIERLKDFAKQDYSKDVYGAENEFLDCAITVHEVANQVHAGFPMLTGTLLLYLAGRFEEFTRTLFEDLCQRLVQRARAFNKLPRKMRDNLVFFTAMVMQSPRKFGHAEGGVRTFLSTLSENLRGDSPFLRVNHECLSITESNMRAEVFSELFSRVGVSSIWKPIGQQAQMQAYFETLDSGNAESQAKRELDKLMDLRNKVAHPSGAIEWPSTDMVIKYVNYIRILARSLTDLIGVYEVTLCQSVQDGVE